MNENLKTVFQFRTWVKSRLCLSVCVRVFVCVCTYSLRGHLGAGGRTVCAKLWTEPAWRYPEPAGQQVTEARNAWLNKPRLCDWTLLTVIRVHFVSQRLSQSIFFSKCQRGDWRSVLVSVSCGSTFLCTSVFGCFIAEEKGLNLKHRRRDD